MSLYFNNKVFTKLFKLTGKEESFDHTFVHLTEGQIHIFNHYNRAHSK